MSLEKEFIRDGKRRIIGSVTSGYVGSFETIVRDEQNDITGSTSERFNTTRDEHGKLVSINTADPGLLIGSGTSSSGICSPRLAAQIFQPLLRPSERHDHQCPPTPSSALFAWAKAN